MSNDPRDNEVFQRNDESAAEDGLNPESKTQPGAVETNDEPEGITLKGRLTEFAARFRRPAESAREQKSGDRLRGALILGATTIGCLFLFFGLFTTTSDSAKKERKTQPSLGRPEGTSSADETANRSVIPQLNVTQQPSEDTGELTESDLLGTMRNRGTPVPRENVPTPPTASRAVPKPPLSTVNFEDPALAEAYRRQGLTPPPRRTTDVTDWNAAIAEHQAQQNARPAATAPIPNSSEALGKSSFVYVRTSVPVVSTAGGAIPTVLPRKPTTLLARGTKLVARLQYAVSSAAKAPVVAVIEYNYEQNGELVIPAGTKAYGTLTQATPQGWVTIQFDALEYPGGEQEKINGSALSMEQEVLHGDVNGKNTGKKFLTRAITGIGTIAAFAVGGRGLGGQVDNSILLRERLSSNVAMAGEQQLAMLAFQQNIVVTLPANTRFYIVLNEPAVAGTGLQQDAFAQRRNVNTVGAQEVPVASPQAGMSPQELQELISIRNEMREMNRLIKLQNPPAVPQQEPEK